MATSALFPLLLGILGVTAAVVLASVIPHPDDNDGSVAREARAAVCHVDGMSIGDGENFTRFQTGPCVVYKCRAGEILPLEYGCLRNSHCYPLGDKYALGCLERTCGLTNGRFDYTLSKEGCQATDGVTCVDVGATWQKGCIVYRCSRIAHSEFSVAYHLDPVSWGCQLNNACVPENHTVMQECRIEQCQRNFGAVGFYTLKLGCPVNGQCLDVGQSTVMDCTTLTCGREDIQGIHYLSIKPTKIQCQDADNLCHDSGTFFPIEANGKRLNCTCFVHEESFGSTYSCPAQ